MQGIVAIIDGKYIKYQLEIAVGVGTKHLHFVLNKLASLEATLV